jgi:hypothetical protein
MAGQEAKAKKSQMRAQRVTLTLRPETLRGVKELAQRNYASLSGYVDGLLREKLAERRGAAA